MKFYGPSTICLKNKWRNKVMIELQLLKLPAFEIEKIRQFMEQKEVEK